MVSCGIDADKEGANENCSLLMTVDGYVRGVGSSGKIEELSEF